MSETESLPLRQLSERELKQRILDIQRESDIAYARQLEAIRELNDRGVTPWGYPSMAEFMAAVLHMDLGEARARVAQAVGGSPLAPSHPADRRHPQPQLATQQDSLSPIRTPRDRSADEKQ
ncbi:hypothetical protein [Amycolatopsis jejuensis]|uniref:hypothetical protein n=1 Tax=Amycolatopsis jejuensis TaxID=330084 RepID=UPI0012E071BE|nr:hypothetical protein [Amycolatopsis jejuensis]